MNIIAAIKSGRPYRRKEWMMLNASISPTCTDYMFSKQDILADDWEVEEKSVEITESRVKQIAQTVYEALVSEGAVLPHDILSILKKELGL